MPRDHSTFLRCCFLFQIDPIIQEGNEGIVHHILLFQCSDDFPRVYLNYDGTVDSPGMAPSAVRKCVSLIAGWAIGGQVLFIGCCTITVSICVASILRTNTWDSVHVEL